MDDRQQQITEGAGLQESRLNTEFIDWLKRWSNTILMVVLVVTLAYVGWTYWGKMKERRLDEAFVNYEAAVDSGSPDSLLKVASEFPNQASVAPLARLRAADIYLEAARSGVAPGGDAAIEADVLTDEQRSTFALMSREQYSEALEEVAGDSKRTLLQLRARDGVASAAISMGDVDAGRKELEELHKAANEAGFVQLAAYTVERIDGLEKKLNQPPMYARENIAAAVLQVGTDLGVSPEQDVDESLPLGDDFERPSPLPTGRAPIGPQAPDPDSEGDDDSDDDG